ncbi:hypothetical protein BB560_005883 [Smittium megazygosporum]|uniref:Uncharacterized protein n=1 Tax=Smittium megazygosporum TaxID=133381 RepID=A0A2T9YRZ1_9FUNG|nr:hypothetical protein BB560_005883 [Smittium megazygosporum]
MVPQNGNVKHNLVLPETFSITQFVDQYTDPSLIQRLLLIGMKCPRYAVEAYTLALQKIKDNTLNVSLYKEASHFATLAKANFDSTLLKESEISNKDAFDIEWIVKAGSDFNEQLAKLNFDFSSIRFNSTVDSKTTVRIVIYVCTQSDKSSFKNDSDKNRCNIEFSRSLYIVWKPD